MLLKKIIPFLLAVLAIPALVTAQVTTGTLTGVVKSEKGESLNGATVTAIHVPTGTRYVTAAKANGLYTIPNMRVGGPYSVTIHFTGYSDQVINDVNIGLGAPVSIDASLSLTTTELSVVTVTSKTRGSIISSQRNGTSTYISSRVMQALPSINRSVQDFARLTPQVKASNNGSDGNSTGLSFAGQSNRYNQFSIDGANASDAFGLGSTGTNGGQANLNPISIDAIQEIQVVLSPYDVTQGGFTGGGINAVTKSGTNKFHGTVYGQLQNQSLVGKSNVYNDKITRTAIPDFTNKTFGASIGGPIIKNKLFFFANYERFIKSTPVAFDPTDPGSGSKVNVDTLKAIKDFMLSKYGYDLGSYGAINNENQSQSFFARIDWNISDKHKLTLRNSFVDGSNDIRSRAATTPLFENTGYKFTDKNNSAVLELNSTFSSKSSNVLRITYNAIRDARISKKAPNLAIYNYDATQKATILYNLGSEYSSAANSLNQDIVSVTDNFTLYRNKHTLTFGTSNEFFKSENVFLQGFYGAYTYGSSGTTTTNNLANWMNNTGLTQYQIGYSTSGRGDKATAALKAAQLSVYAQDVYAPTKNFRLTYGIRIDRPLITSKPAENTAFNNDFAALDVKTNQMPKARLMFSPRVGFNWDVEGNATLQVRGGVGLFTGRIPFVWISNQLSNTGIATKNLTYNTAAVTSNGIKYTFDPNDGQLGAFIPASTAAAATVINVIDKNFKFPQVFRGNLAVDKKLVPNVVLTLEGVFTKTVNNAFYKNLNISDNGEGTVAIASTTRPLWTKYTNANYAQVIKLQNTNKGYSMNFTVQLQKTLSKGWAGSLAYTWGTASSYNDIPSSVALSNWRGTQTVNGLNKLDFSASNFDMGSRISGFITKEFKYLNKQMATSITLFYNGQSGQALSYVYSRNITGDDIGTTSSTTSLAYIPATFTEASFVDITGGATASQQWADFQAYAAANKYLQKNAGKVAQRNGDRLPFENHFDLRIAQDFMVKSHKLQVFFDVVNLGALLQQDAGRSYGNGDGFFPQTSTLFTVINSGAQKRDGVTVATPTTAAPVFQFNINNFTKIGETYRPYSVSTFTSRWSSQIGLRYSF